jgi:hypothetical protein
MNLILRIWLFRGKTKIEKFKLLNDYANFTSKYFKPLYLNYCNNLKKIKNEINNGK